LPPATRAALAEAPDIPYVLLLKLLSYSSLPCTLHPLSIAIPIQYKSILLKILHSYSIVSLKGEIKVLDIF
jgi:hypothetical protein